MKYRINKKILTSELLLLLIFNIILLSLPLTNILGYEYSALNGMLISFLSGILVISSLKGEEGKSFKDFITGLFQNFLPLIILPLLMSFIAAIFTRNCSLCEGVLYYIVLAVPSLIIGSSLGTMSFLFSKRSAYLTFIILYLIILFLPIIYIYLNPQIYFYNPIIGYYPGTIYDEAVKIDFKLVSYRILNIIYFSAAFYFSFRLINKKDLKAVSKSLFFVLTILTAFIFILSGDFSGYSTTKGRIINALGGHAKSEHFEIYYDRKIDLGTVKNIILHSEYYFEEISEEMKVRPSKKVTVFLFYDSQEKKELLGSENADVAKPWLYQLYINYGNFDRTLQHELVHVISSEFGVTPFKISHGFNPSLLEGLAVAFEDNYDEHTVHYMAQLAYNNNFRIPIEKLFSGLNFFGELSSLSYIYSGSFIKFLIDKYGVEKFKEIYRGGNYLEVYGKSLESLVGEYYNFISSYGKTGGSDEAVYYYGRKPIFKKVCARFLAENIDRGWDLYNKGEYAEAEDLFRKLLKYSESYQSLLGYVSSLRKTDKPRLALSALEENLNKYKKTSYYYNLELLTGDLYALNRNFTKADSLYNKLLKEKVSSDFDNVSSIRKVLIQDTSLIIRYLKGSDFDKYNILKALNADSVNSASVAILAGLSEKLDENPAEFIKAYKTRLHVDDYVSAYAAFKLSLYAQKNLETLDAREMAIAALGYKADKDFQEVLRLQLKKLNWFLNFGQETLSKVKLQ